MARILKGMLLRKALYQYRLLENAETKIVQATNSDKNARTHIRTQYSISDN